MYSVAIEVEVRRDLPDPLLAAVLQDRRVRQDHQDPSSRDPSCLGRDLAFQPVRIRQVLLRVRRGPWVPFRQDLEDLRAGDPSPTWGDLAAWDPNCWASYHQDREVLRIQVPFEASGHLVLVHLDNGVP